MEVPNIRRQENVGKCWKMAEKVQVEGKPFLSRDVEDDIHQYILGFSYSIT